MRIDERIREEKNGKRDDYQHDDRHGVQRLPRLFDKNPVRALDILRSHAYSHVNAQTTAVEVVDDRAEPGRPVVLAWIDYARIFLRDLTYAKWDPGLFESAAIHEVESNSRTLYQIRSRCAAFGLSFDNFPVAVLVGADAADFAGRLKVLHLAGNTAFRYLQKLCKLYIRHKRICP